MIKPALEELEVTRGNTWDAADSVHRCCASALAVHQCYASVSCTNAAQGKQGWFSFDGRACLQTCSVKMHLVT